MQDLKEILNDPNNDEPITLYDKNDQPIVFEQIASMGYDDKLYCLLRPVTKVIDIAEDEALVFFLDESGDTPHLVVETDDDKIKAVFDIYYKLLEDNEYYED